MFKKRFVLLGFFLILFLLIPLIFFRAEADNVISDNSLPTVYKYSSESIRELNSDLLISEPELRKWDEAIEKHFKNHLIPYSTQMRLFTYLYIAQRDAAFLSYNVHNCFIGSLDPLNKKIVQRILPNFSEFPQVITDEYSDKLADLVFSKYDTRMNKEDANKHTFHSSCWLQEIPEGDAQIAKWIPWLPPLPKPPPPSQNKKEQTKLMKKEARNYSEKNFNLILECSTRDFREIANKCMEENCVPIGKILLVRSILMSGIYDGIIAVQDAKYSYCVPRPAMEDSEIVPMFPGLMTPAYPSGHAACAMVAATILTHFFPDECQEWKQLAKEVGNSRIWSLVHTPEEVEAGYKLGEEIGTKHIEEPLTAQVVHAESEQNFIALAREMELQA